MPDHDDAPAPTLSARTWAIPIASLIFGLIASACAPQPDDAGPSSASDSTASSVASPSASSQESSAEPSPNATDDTGLPGPGTAEEPAVVASGLEAPWAIAFHGDTPLVSLRDSGTIVEIGADGAVREVAQVDGVVFGGEGGLLGIAVHADELFAYSTGADGNRIQAFDITGEPGELGLGEARTLLGGIPAAGNHNGGRLAVGLDGMLYATTGDAGRPGIAQDPDSLGGKILRMTMDGDVPSDNPFPDSYTYSLGHRNPQGIAWHDDGRMFASEFGQDTWDELNIIEPGGNYGWPQVEGRAGDGERDDTAIDAGIGDHGRTDPLIDPIVQWSPDEASPSGIAVTDTSVWIANLRGERLRGVGVGEYEEEAELLDGDYGRLRDVVRAPDGALWVLTNATDGRGDPGPDDDRILSFEP